MRKALHPQSGLEIDVNQYIIEFGNGHHTNDELPLCKICKQRMSIVAASTPNTIGHFRHLPNSKFCPAKEQGGVLYANFPPQHPDQEAARRMKEDFMQNWQIYFSRLNNFVKFLSKREFYAVIEAADAARIWEYAQLKNWQIPYIFATLIDFPAENSRTGPKGEKREHYFRCFFDNSVNRYDDLWIDPNSQPSFWRAWFATEPGRRPHAKDLINAYPLEVTSDYLQKRHWVPPFYVDEIQAWLNRRYGMGQ